MRARGGAGAWRGAGRGAGRGGTSAQTAAWQARCDRDQQIAAFNEAQALEAQRMQLEAERMRLENAQFEREQERARQTRLAEIEARRQARLAELDARNQELDGQAAARPQATATRSVRFLVFGGKKHDVFLGCLCDETDPDSVLNKYGTFGSPYRSESIWNNVGDYGSTYSDTSACSRLASSPPVVVTEGGDFIGYLTIDKLQAGAITEPGVYQWLETVVCGD